MAKKKKAKKAAEKAVKLDKKAIRAYYKENGWKETISKFGIAPKDLSPIVKGKKAKEAAPKKKPKKKTKKGAKATKAAAPKKKKAKGKKAKKGKTVDAPYGYKKDGTPKKPPGRKAGKKAGKKASKADAAPKKKRGRPKKKAAAAAAKPAKRPGRPKRAAAAAGSEDMVLDWLLAYRAKNQKSGHMMPLDSVIIDLTTKLRK